MERIDGSKPGSPIRVGSKFRQYIDMGNMKTNKERIIPLEFTVASLDDDDDHDNTNKRTTTTYPRTLAVYSDDFTQRIPGRVSATVEPGADRDTTKSNLRITSTLLPKTLCMLLGGNALICVCNFRTIMETMIERDLEEFARAAEAAAEKPLQTTRLPPEHHPDHSPERGEDTQK